MVYIQKRKLITNTSSLFDNEYPGYHRLQECPKGCPVKRPDIYNDTILDAKIYLLTTLTNFGVD